MIKAFFIIAISLLFLDFTGTVHTYLGWCAKIQFIPAILAANIAVFAGIILLTFIFGRFYCFMICPLGILQDIISGKKRFSYRPPRKPLIILRYALLLAFVISLLLAAPLMTLLEPYSAYGRIVSQLLGPVYKWGNNLLAYFAERAGSYAFYSIDVWLKGVTPLVLAIVTLLAVGISAWKSGRGYCNTICPVGAFLGLLSKFSVIKPRIDKEKCKHCGICAKSCKAACIDTTRAEIDYLRCITCLKCIKSCPAKAIKYAPPSTGADKLSKDGLARRGVMTGTAALALSLVTRSHANQFDGGLAQLEDKKAPMRTKPIVPPGAISYHNLHDRCTGCQLCVSVCPNQVLRPRTTKVNMSYERGYCRPECVKCSEVCPTGAIRPITTAEKSSIQIGTAVWNKELCIINKDNATCDLCARKCPVAAIEMMPFPIIDTSRCIGCGACEHLCPSRPHSAIHVEGVETHREV